MIMKEYYKDEFKKLMQEYPEGGIVFTAVDERNLMVTDGPFGATEVIPYEGKYSILIGILMNTEMMIGSLCMITMMYFR